MRQCDILRYEKGGETLKWYIKRIMAGELLDKNEFSGLKSLNETHSDVTKKIVFKRNGGRNEKVKNV